MHPDSPAHVQSRGWEEAEEASLLSEAARGIGSGRPESRVDDLTIFLRDTVPLPSSQLVLLPRFALACVSGRWLVAACHEIKRRDGEPLIAPRRTTHRAEARRLQEDY
ncbi:hypothetical protein J3458_004575 [Metarhizium acridum]|uniref:uncharacterized protein n=1 Tax=Metarhizium acridum TaxID=92637 RepID=UPI001C6CA2E6|nr:hypothetical protein J3458_004575 [Metarhizium acridum]